MDHSKLRRHDSRPRLRFAFAFAFALAGCGTSLPIAEQKKELGASDGGVPSDAEPTSIDGPDAIPEVVTICGNARCTNKVANVAGAEVVGFACCVNPRTSQCGIVGFGTVCLELDKIGKLDPTCAMPPGSPLSSLPGCCRPEGNCGVVESDLGLGCSAVPFWTELTSCTY